MNAAEEDAAADASTAIQAEALYLLNLLVMPGLAFVALLWLAHRHANTENPLTCCHLRQTVRASLWAGALLTLVTLLIVLLGGFDQASTWAMLILYFTTCHASLVLCGVLGLARAMAGQCYVYPLIGNRSWQT